MPASYLEVMTKIQKTTPTPHLHLESVNKRGCQHLPTIKKPPVTRRRNSWHIKNPRRSLPEDNYFDGFSRTAVSAVHFCKRKLIPNIFNKLQHIIQINSTSSNLLSSSSLILALAFWPSKPQQAEDTHDTSNCQHRRTITLQGACGISMDHSVTGLKFGLVLPAVALHPKSANLTVFLNCTQTAQTPTQQYAAFHKITHPGTTGRYAYI